MSFVENWNVAGTARDGEDFPFFTPAADVRKQPAPSPQPNPGIYFQWKLDTVQETTAK